MDFVKRMAGSHDVDSKDSKDSHDHGKPNKEQNTNDDFVSRISNKLNTAAGGGRESEKNEDLLDKGIDIFQERLLGQGKQDNESAIEQRKDEAISDAIRKGYKNISGREFPIKDKPTRF